MSNTTNNEKLIDKTYVLAKKEFNDAQFTTSQLWKAISKQENLSSDKDQYVTFYVDLLQDPRFVAIGNDKWKLRDYVSKEEFGRLSNSKYSNVEYSTVDDKDDEKIIDELIDEETDLSDDGVVDEEYYDDEMENDEESEDLDDDTNESNIDDDESDDEENEEDIESDNEDNA